MFEELLSFLIHALTQKAEKILGRLNVNPQLYIYNIYLFMNQPNYIIIP